MTSGANLSQGAGAPGPLTALTQVALSLEQLVVLLAPAVALLLAFTALSWTGFWLAAPPPRRIAGDLRVLAALLVGGPGAAAPFALDRRPRGPRGARSRPRGRPRRRARRCAGQCRRRADGPAVGRCTCVARGKTAKLRPPLPAPRLAAQDRSRAWARWPCWRSAPRPSWPAPKSTSASPPPSTGGSPRSRTGRGWTPGSTRRATPASRRWC